ncbi:hypothetical protein Tco_1305206 [Tanacetum coccineum]
MPPKRTSTSEAPTMTQAAIKKLVADSVFAALEAQAANMANTDNTTRQEKLFVRSYVMQSVFLTQEKVSSIPIVFSWSDRIRPEGFLSSVLLWLMIIVAVAGVCVTVVVVIIIVIVVDVGVTMPMEEPTC